MSDDTSNDLALTYTDVHSTTWLKVRTFLEVRLDTLRRKNDSINLTPEQTAVLRGQITELKNLLAAGVSQD